MEHNRVIYTEHNIRRVFRFDNKRFVIPMSNDNKYKSSDISDEIQDKSLGNTGIEQFILGNNVN